MLSQRGNRSDPYIRPIEIIDRCVWREAGEAGFVRSSGEETFLGGRLESDRSQTVTARLEDGCRVDVSD